MDYETAVIINGRELSSRAPTYFIADIAANHDGELARAKDLVWRAKEAGAEAAKFQHFLAKDIVSDHGFKNLGRQSGHQAGWKKSVYEIFEDYQFNRDWNEELFETCQEAEIEFMTTPYDLAAVKGVDQYVNAYKIGSGDITWISFIKEVAGHGKPIFLATGASDMEDVERAVDAVLGKNKMLCLMQCNTNYSAAQENFRHINLNVLKTFAEKYPGLLLGMSDHMPGHSSVLGAVALGARVVEKHFTDDGSRDGPDHGFSMTPETWRTMVARTRELEDKLGDGVKRIEENEKESVVLQRRCLRFKRDKSAGETLTEGDLECLRPAPEGSVEPYRIDQFLGRELKCDRVRGDALHAEDVGSKT